MHAYVRRCLYGTLGAGGLLLLGAVGASADTTTTGSHGAASGTQVVTPVSAPAGAQDNAIAVLGRSSATRAGQPGGAVAAPAKTGGADTSGSRGAGSGTQAIAPMATPVTARGNAVSVLGRSDSSQSSSRSDAGSSNRTPAGTTTGGGSRTSGERGAASGTQVVAPVSAPVAAGGNSVSVLGRSSAVEGESNKAPSGASRPSSSGAGSGSTTSGSRGVASGSQVSAPVSTPVSVTGNSIALLGSSSTASGTAGTSGVPGEAGQPAAATPTTSGDGGAASGTQALAPVAVPVAVEGNAISVLGRSSSAGTANGTPAEDPAGAAYTRGASTSGTNGLGSGTQTSTPVVAPIAVGGNAVSVLGQSTARAPEASAAPGEELPQGAGSGPGDTTGGHPAGSAGEPQGGATGDEPVGMPEEQASGEAIFGVGGFGSGTHVSRPVPARVSTDGNAGVAVSDASSTSDGVTSPGSPSGSSAGGLGSGSGAEGAAGGHDPCVANIALMSRATQDVRSAGLAGGNVAGTALSAVMFLLLGAAIARTLRRKGVRATA